MTAQVATTPISSGTVVTEIPGAVAGTDSVPAGCVLLVRNTGAGTHTLVLGIGATIDGLPVNTAGSRVITLTTLQVQTVRVPAAYGDANGRVPIAVGEGTFAEVKYTPIGA